MIIHVSADDLHAALADIDEGRDVQWRAEDGTPVTIRNGHADASKGEASEA